MSARSGESATRSIKNLEKRSFSRRLLLQFFLTSTAEIVVVLLLYLIAGWAADRFTWQAGILYDICKLIEQLSGIWIPLVCVAILIHNMLKTLREPLQYLDDVVLEAEKLADPAQGRIHLPEDLESVEYHMNTIREKAIENRRKAEEAERRKNDMIVYLAHDLKTPLTNVIGYLSLLQEEKELPEAQREKFTNVALEKAYRLEDLINEFFDITRFNLTHVVLEKHPLHLSRMLEQTIFEFQPALAEKNLRIELNSPEEVSILADGDKLQRVIDNLLRNAVMYSDPASTIQMSLQKEGEDAVIRIINSGNTIPKDKLDRLFEQFFRLDPSRGTHTGGAGLGLAIAKEIVQLHGGEITAESTDHLVIFTVRLPQDE